jgi:hypothetical protein
MCQGVVFEGLFLLVVEWWEGKVLKLHPGIYLDALVSYWSIREYGKPYICYKLLETRIKSTDIKNPGFITDSTNQERKEPGAVYLQ